MSWTEDAYFKIATVMIVKSQVEELVWLLPTALTHMFNKHPKMCATQVRGEFAVGEIHPKITLEQIEEHQLLLVRTTDAEGMQSTHWHQYAQEQVDIPFDRFTQFPLCLHVWADPLPADAIGSCATATPLEKLTQGCIDLSTKHFWDIARAAKQETVDISSSFPTIAIPMAVTDQVYNSQREPEFSNDAPMPYSSSGDAMISSVKCYAYPTNHTFQHGDLTVETVHYSCRTGYMASLGQFYVSSTKRVCYGCNHCYEEHSGKLLFETIVAFLERAGRVASNDTLADVIAQVPTARQSSAGSSDATKIAAVA
ncbi:hypothetical protein FI667_g14441, partial [Globisporangium splendens]